MTSLSERELFAAMGCPYDAPAYVEPAERRPVHEGIIGVAGPSSAKPNTMRSGRRVSARTGTRRPFALPEVLAR